MRKYVENIGHTIRETMEKAVGEFRLFVQALYWIFVGPFIKKPLSWAATSHQMVFAGVRSLVIVFFVAFFTGIVLAMQSAYQLVQFGVKSLVASLVSVSMCRELGPVFAALVVTGRVGSAITAEISSMKVNEQIEALDTMAINPVRFLVAPRLLALMVMLPCLTIIADIIGMLGGFVIGFFTLNINPGLYMDMTVRFLQTKDIYTGLTKSLVFGIIIATVGCYEGLHARGGAEGVGRSTTVSVVSSFIMVILADCILTAVFYFTDI
ncbi:MAG: ABC transporter permease [Candidatus Omnitrophica bacterium]|nr:ABC transporter permease [Candidatus Omnitrophota bacterium]